MRSVLVYDVCVLERMYILLLDGVFCKSSYSGGRSGGSRFEATLTK
jgi:hypothetical protein